MVLRFFLFASVIFLISCGEIERNNPDDPDSPNYVEKWISSSVEPSSSSVAPSSSSNTIVISSSSIQSSIVYGPPVYYQGETYETVVIGTQTWFQRNLNYAIEGSKCYNDNPANCAIYGRLYEWVDAMDFPDPNRCYTTGECPIMQQNHQGICPSGWHIPSLAEWDTLKSYIQNDKGCSGICYAEHLKATNGWNGGNGQDTYGFAALPGGLYGSAPYNSYGYNDVGYQGYWVTASVDHMYYLGYAGSPDWYDENAFQYYSIRCLQNNPTAGISSSSVSSSSSAKSSSSFTAQSSSSSWSSSSSSVAPSSSSSAKSSSSFTAQSSSSSWSSSSSSVAQISSSSVHTSSSSLECVESDKNIIKNGNFTNKDSWTINIGPEYGYSEASFDVLNNKATINVIKIGHMWEPNLTQYGITLVEGTNYRITFEASASANRKIGVIIQMTGGNYDTYFEKEINLTTTSQSFTYDFKMISPSDENVLMGFTLGQATGTVTLSKVALYSLEGTSCL